jgi:hypothetical protein
MSGSTTTITAASSVTTGPLPETASSAATTTSPSTAESVSLDRVVELARADLAMMLDLDGSDITTVDASLVTWPDASLGCPEPGAIYPQTPTDGASVLLGVGGQTYEFHSGHDGVPFRCPRIEIPPPID